MTLVILVSVIASYYWQPQAVASGGRFDPKAMTCAHKSLPFGIPIKVTYKHRSVVCTINDRGPYIKGRSLDLSYAAAAQIGMLEKGVARVTMQTVWVPELPLRRPTQETWLDFIVRKLGELM